MPVRAKSSSPHKRARARPVSLRLMSNIQFLYELVLAQRELAALGVDFTVGSDLRSFAGSSKSPVAHLARKLAYFEQVDSQRCDYARLVEFNVTRSINQYLTHWIYPYKGKFHPQMVRALLNWMGVEHGDLVLDPFVGSGTTLVECQVLGIDSVGFDVSPLCVLISRVKTESVEVVPELEAQEGRPPPAEGDTAPSLFAASVPTACFSEKAANFFRLAGLVSLSDRTRRRREFRQAYHENVQKMLRSVRMMRRAAQELNLSLGNTRAEVADARSLPLPDGSVDAIITSPPYSIALDYVQNDAHALAHLGFDLTKMREEFVGVRGTGERRLGLYRQDMAQAIREMHRVLKPGGGCAIVIGNVTYQGKQVDTVAETEGMAMSVGLKQVERIEKIIYGLYNVIQQEYILLFRKPHKRQRDPRPDSAKVIY